MSEIATPAQLRVFARMGVIWAVAATALQVLYAFVLWPLLPETFSLNIGFRRGGGNDAVDGALPLIISWVAAAVAIIAALVGAAIITTRRAVGPGIVAVGLVMLLVPAFYACWLSNVPLALNGSSSIAPVLAALAGLAGGLGLAVLAFRGTRPGRH